MPVDVADYLKALVDRARSVLGDVLLGAYVTGSVALDAYEPGRSDVDVALVVTRALDRDEREALVALLRHEAPPCPGRGLELVVHRADIAAAGSPEPGFELELNTGARMPYRVTFRPEDRPGTDGRFWYALDRSLLHQRGRTLAGPPAGDVFADLRPAETRRMLIEALRWWLAAAGPQACSRGQSPASGPSPGAGPPRLEETPATDDAVLNACRALVRVHDGIWLSKVAAGRRVQELGVAPGSLIDVAIAARHGGHPPDVAEAREFQERVLAELAGR